MEKKTIPSSLVIPYKSAYSNAGFNVANTNRMMKIHVAKQLKYVKVIFVKMIPTAFNSNQKNQLMFHDPTEQTYKELPSMF